MPISNTTLPDFMDAIQRGMAQDVTATPPVPVERKPSLWQKLAGKYEARQQEMREAMLPSREDDRPGITADTRGPLAKASSAVGRSRIFEKFVTPVLEAVNTLSGKTEAGVLGAVGGPLVRLPQVTKVLQGGRISPTVFTGGNTRLTLERALSEAAEQGAKGVREVYELRRAAEQALRTSRSPGDMEAVQWLRARTARHFAETGKTQTDLAVGRGMIQTWRNADASSMPKEQVIRILRQMEEQALSRMTSTRLAATTTVREGTSLHGILTDIIQQGTTRPLHAVQGRGRPIFDNALRNTPTTDLGQQLKRLDGIPPIGNTAEDGFAVVWMYSRIESEIAKRALKGDMAARRFLLTEKRVPLPKRMTDAHFNTVYRRHLNEGIKMEEGMLKILTDMGAIS